MKLGGTILSTLYAQVIVDITSGRLDKTFQYRVPEAMADSLAPGAAVQVPFGRGDRLVEAYVIETGSKPEIDPAKIKDIHAISPGNVPVEGELIRLAFWMKQQYGASMIQCLKTVMPVARKVKPVTKREIRRLADPDAYSRILE
ncbi:MAG: primosomal protein N', partial [Lachnospiraceae bacterium]|nr:primosomal protein N' [Lachnospiraceae bacterium]